MNSGKQFIAGQRVGASVSTLKSINAKTGEPLSCLFSQATLSEVEQAADAAAAVFKDYHKQPLDRRAAFLDAIADEIDRMDDDFVTLVSAETGLPEARIKGERTRTSNQMRMFADYVRARGFLGVRIDTFEGTDKPVLRQYNVGVGPVAVFGASNFPLAFSTAGVDTAAALAAGCPVVVKAHSGHMKTAEMTAEAIERARVKSDMPAGVFNMIYGGRIGADLVRHPKIRAVGFTGSLSGGKALIDIANSRPNPIPVFAEMSSINPVIMLNDLLSNKAAEVAGDLVASFTLGSGQFCTKPGLILGLRTEAFERFVSELTQKVSALSPMVMLNPSTLKSYEQRRQEFDESDALKLLAKGQDADMCAGARLYRTDVATLIANKMLVQEEIFGPAAIIVSVESQAQLLDALATLDGQLTASLFGEEAELAEAGELVDALQEKAGRLIVNNYPTSVEVSHAMVHGGPWPATSDSRGTSVGSMAINRFMRPVCFQNYPDALLPDELTDAGLSSVPHMLNGKYVG